MLSPPVRRRCCVRRSRRHCTAPRCRRRTGKPLGSCGFPARHARSESIVATYTLPGRIPAAPRALCCNRATSSPHPWRLISRLRPRFCATRVPGCSRVPRAERVIARTFKSSTRMVSKRRARSVVVFSTQSRRRSVSGRATSQWPAWFVRAGQIRVAPGPDAAAIGAVVGFRRHEGQEHAAAARWTGPPRPPRRDPHPPRCHHRVPGRGRGWRQKRCASAQSDPG